MSGNSERFSDESVLPQLLSRGSAFVEYRDYTGVHWRVSERNTANAPGTHGTRCLIFDSGEVIRRVWHYPATWCSLSADELIALSWTV
ncbi:MAG: hypothetical protein ABIT91_15815 [Gemmatimonadaceae bacterium]